MKRSVRYLAPLAVVGLVALAAAIPTLRAGAAVADLPPLGAQRLIARVAGSDVTAWQGTVALQANLGIPDLSGVVGADGGQVATSSGFDPTTLLSGTHSFEVWTDGQDQRIALPRSMGETDFVRTGSQAWLYDSGSQQVTHYVGAAPADGSSSKGGSSISDAAPVLTPDQEAARLLGALGPSTTVSVAPGTDVAGQPAYLLTLVPKAGSPGATQSTLDRITISIDAANGLPLDVAVYAKTVSTPVLELGYTSVSFTAPAAVNFTAPVGTSTVTKTIADTSAAGGEQGTGHRGSPVSGPAWAWVVSIPAGSSKAAAALHSGAIDAATTAVTGSFGTARLLSTKVVNVLVLPDGAVLAGFVGPATLEADSGGVVRVVISSSVERHPLEA